MIDIASIKTEQDLAAALDSLGFISDSPDPVRFGGSDTYPSRCLFWKVNPELAYPVGIVVMGSELRACYYDVCNDWFSYFDGCAGQVPEDEVRQLIIDASIPRLVLLEANNDWNAVFTHLKLYSLPADLAPDETEQYQRAYIVDATLNSLPKDVKIAVSRCGSIALLVYNQERRQFIVSEIALPRLMAENVLKKAIRAAACKQAETH